VAVTFVNLGRLNLLIALAIAFTKASLVVMFFMNARRSSPLTKVFIFSGILWFAILITLTFSDFVSRTWLPESGAWPNPGALNRR
jgi:cytochrome c oxidase subunit 4